MARKARRQQKRKRELWADEHEEENAQLCDDRPYGEEKPTGPHDEAGEKRALALLSSVQCPRPLVAQPVVASRGLVGDLFPVKYHGVAGA